jgi:hypothetical protein
MFKSMPMPGVKLPEPDSDEEDEQQPAGSREPGVSRVMVPTVLMRWVFNTCCVHRSDGFYSSKPGVTVNTAANEASVYALGYCCTTGQRGGLPK